jgi:hypothetical protein
MDNQYRIRICKKKQLDPDYYTISVFFGEKKGGASCSTLSKEPCELRRQFCFHTSVSMGIDIDLGFFLT